MPTQVTFSKLGVGVVLMKLARHSDPAATALYAHIMGGWGNRLDRTHVTVPVDEDEHALLASLKVPPAIFELDVVESARWLAVYSDPANPAIRVTVRSKDKPPKRKTFRIAGGNKKLHLVDLTELNPTKQDREDTPKMAKKNSKKTAPADELDELAGLEELDDLEELEAPDVEDDDVEEAPAKKRRGRKAAAPVEEDEDDADDDTEDEDEDDLGSKTVKELRTLAKEKGITGANKMGKDALIEAIGDLDLTKKTLKELRELAKESGVKGYRKLGKDELIEALEAEDDNEESDDEDEVEEAPKQTKAQKKAAAKDPKKKGPTPPVRELPDGKLGADAIAKAAGVEAREVRVFLRKLGDDAKAKYMVDGRWAFTQKQVDFIAKKIKAKG